MSTKKIAITTTELFETQTSDHPLITHAKPVIEIELS
jgi:hypothetical protein